MSDSLLHDVVNILRHSQFARTGRHLDTKSGSALPKARHITEFHGFGLASRPDLPGSHHLGHCMDDFENPFESRHRKHVANCPRCRTSHSYVDVKHSMFNDPGYWVVQCSSCSKPFCIAGLHDVFDSYMEAASSSSLKARRATSARPNSPSLRKWLGTT